MNRRADTEKSVASWICIGVCVLSALLIWPTQRFIESRNVQSDEDPDILLFSSPTLLKNMALGYRSLLADLYWIRTIQYYGRFEEADKRKIRYKNLYTLLDITTTLDPNFLEVYHAGGFFIADEPPFGAGQPEEALKFMDKGFRENPLEWKILHDKGFIYYWYLKDFKAAGNTWLEAGKVPGAPEWLPLLAATSMSKGGEFEIALALWQERYQQSSRANEKETALNQIISFYVARDIWGWEALAEQYKEKYGTFPPTLRALAGTPLGRSRRYSLNDPLGEPYDYDPVSGGVMLSTDSKVKYLTVPDIYKESLIKVDALPIIIP